MNEQGNNPVLWASFYLPEKTRDPGRRLLINEVTHSPMIIDHNSVIIRFCYHLVQLAMIFFSFFSWELGNDRNSWYFFPLLSKNNDNGPSYLPLSVPDENCLIQNSLTPGRGPLIFLPNGTSFLPKKKKNIAYRDQTVGSLSWIRA